MNIYNSDDEKFVSSSIYQEFLENNPGRGSLKIRAYAASQAIPIRGLKVVVSTTIQDNQVIFFDGYTNESGIIDGIILPAPRINVNNLDVPNKIVYDIVATYIPDNIQLLYRVNLYDDVCVVQNINIVPDSMASVGDV